MARSKLLEVRLPTAREKSLHGGDVVFVRQDAQGTIHYIHACKSYESYQQWNAPTSILGDNVGTVTAWRRSKLKVKPPRGN